MGIERGFGGFSVFRYTDRDWWGFGRRCGPCAEGVDRAGCAAAISQDRDAARQAHLVWGDAGGRDGVCVARESVFVSRQFCLIDRSLYSCLLGVGAGGADVAAF